MKKYPGINSDAYYLTSIVSAEISFNVPVEDAAMPGIGVDGCVHLISAVTAEGVTCDFFALPDTAQSAAVAALTGTLADEGYVKVLFSREKPITGRLTQVNIISISK